MPTIILVPSLIAIVLAIAAQLSSAGRILHVRTRSVSFIDKLYSPDRTLISSIVRHSYDDGSGSLTLRAGHGYLIPVLYSHYFGYSPISHNEPGSLYKLLKADGYNAAVWTNLATKTLAVPLDLADAFEHFYYNSNQSFNDFSSRYSGVIELKCADGSAPFTMLSKDTQRYLQSPYGHFHLCDNDSRNGDGSGSGGSGGGLGDFDPSVVSFSRVYALYCWAVKTSSLSRYTFNVRPSNNRDPNHVNSDKQQFFDGTDWISPAVSGKQQEFINLDNPRKRLLAGPITSDSFKHGIVSNGAGNSKTVATARIYLKLRSTKYKVLMQNGDLELVDGNEAGITLHSHRGYEFQLAVSSHLDRLKAVLSSSQIDSDPPHRLISHILPLGIPETQAKSFENHVYTRQLSSLEGIPKEFNPVRLVCHDGSKSIYSVGPVHDGVQLDKLSICLNGNSNGLMLQNANHETLYRIYLMSNKGTLAQSLFTVQLNNRDYSVNQYQVDLKNTGIRKTPHKTHKKHKYFDIFHVKG